MTLEEYFESALAVFFTESNLHTQILKIGDRQIQLKFSSYELIEQFLPSVRHLESESKGETQLTIYVGDEDTLHKKLKAPPWIDETFNAQGFPPAINQDNYQIFFQPWIRQVYLFSRKHKISIYWVKSKKEIPWWEKTFSFRVIFHWWTRDLPAQLMHAGAIAEDPENGFLITGASGSGKSTTCLNLVQNGFKYLGDDYIWIEQGEQNKIIALYQSAKLEADNYLERFESWHPFLKNPESFKQEKAIFDMREIFLGNWLREAKIKGILLPQVTGNSKSKIDPAKPLHSLMAIAPTTLHHLPYHRQIAYKKIAEIVAGTKTYSWKLSTDKNTNFLEFKKFLANGKGTD